MSSTLTCAAVEELLADYFDGTLGPETRAAVERHVSACAECAELAQDAQVAMQFMAKVQEPAVPPFLVNRIMHSAPSRWTDRLSQRDGVRGWINRLLAPVLQPRVVMGAMMTVLSLSMMTRCAGAPNHPLTAADLDPGKVWAAFDGRVHRVFERTVKTYESMRVVFEVQSRLREWRQSESDPGTADTAIENRKVTVTTPKADAGSAKPAGGNATNSSSSTQ